VTPSSLSTLELPAAAEETKTAGPLALGRHGLDWRGWLLAGCLILALLPVAVSQAINLRFRPHYQFAPVLLAGACWLAFARGKSKWNTGRTSPVLAATLLFVGWSLLAAGMLLRSDWVRSVSVLWIVAGFVCAVGGRALFRALIPAFVLVAILIPLPLQLDTDTIVGLQSVTSRSSSWLLDVLDIPHVAAGHVVEIPDHRMLIEKECSGINSLWTAIVFVLFLGFWLKRPLWHTLLLACGSFALALVANVSRVSAGAWLLAHYDIDVLAGWRHEALGVVLFVAVLALALSLDQLLLFLTEAVYRGPMPGDPPLVMPEATLPGRPATPGFSLSRFTVLGFACAFALLGCLQISSAMSQPAPGLVRPVLPERLGAWRQVPLDAADMQHTYPHGLVSEVWHYQLGKLTALVTFDGPFSSWHELTRCYQSQGWQVSQRSVQEPDSSSPFVEVQFDQPLKAQALLYFGMRKQAGGWLKAERSPGSARERFLTRFTELSAREPDSTIVQVQVLAQSYSPLSAEERQQLRELFTLVQRALDAPATDRQESTP
jgi:exosortase